MPWSYKVNSGSMVVEVVYEGIITASDLQDATSELIGIENERGLNRFLIDATQMQLDPSVSMMQIYDLPADRSVNEDADRLGRVAIIPPETADAREAVEFYETVCINRGWMVQIFHDQQEAADWLI